MIKMDWQSIYHSRQKKAEQAISVIQPLDTVFFAPFCNEPQTLAEELVNQRNRLQSVSIYNLIIGSPCVYAEPHFTSNFKIRTFLSSSRLKHTFVHGDGDYIPINLSELSEWIRRQNAMDVGLIQVSPPNEDGFCNLGISVDVVPSLIKKAKVVIAEVNEYLPKTFGETLVHVSDIDHFVHSDRKPLTIPNGVPSEIEMKIGQYVSELIPDYATLQVGLGKIADSVLMSLTNKKGLGIHSGSITDSVMHLMEQGIITNEHKELHPLKTVCTTLTGTEDLYAFANRNHDIELYPAEYTHNPAVVAQLSNFYSVNSALEVDLFGQINAEQVNGVTLAGVGGQMDFIHGARLSKGGKAIIALPSTAKKGSQSRIKTTISQVTSLKSEIDFVVTEFGIASLFGKSLKERAAALIEIAHPKFREQLSAESRIQATWP